VERKSKNPVLAEQQLAALDAQLAPGKADEAPIEPRAWARVEPAVAVNARDAGRSGRNSGQDQVLAPGSATVRAGCD
jgi:hypothetical protein